MASLLMDGRRPFAGLDRESVTRIKLGEDEDLTAAKQVEDELERHAKRISCSGDVQSTDLARAY